jgi:protein disulfide-isomerase A1
MKLLSLLLGLLAPVLYFAAKIDVEDGVLVLNEANFDDAIQEHKHILVEFYAPWCGHCKSLAPEYAKAAKALGDSPVKLAKVDATVQTALGQRFEVRGFPTLKFFKNGKPTEYSGGRTEKEILRWLEKKTGPSTTSIASVAELEKFQESHEAFALGVFSALDSDAARAFTAAADGDDLHAYAITTDAGVKGKLGVSADTVVVLKSYDDLRGDLTVASDLTADAVTAFLHKASTPLVQEFSQETAKTIFGSPIKEHVLFFTNKNSPQHSETVAAYREVSKAFQGEYLFVNVPSSEGKVLEFFEISSDALPQMVLANLGSEGGILKYPFPKTQSHSVDNVKAFITSYKQGEFQPHMKSEEVAPEDVQGDVTVVKGKSFQQIVLDSRQSVLVEFYAPWCGHCKQLAPVWEDLGKQLKTHKDKVTIAKMDATANEVSVPGMAVKGFPTIYFFPAGDKSHPVQYDGSRDLNGFLKFLSQKTGLPLGGGDDNEEDEDEDEGNDEL